MILIPEKKIVVIMPPRTASTALKAAILKRYPDAITLYRHMEADGVPFGYDRWRKVGVVRDPVARLWSLYKYCRAIPRTKFPAYVEKMARSVAMPFSEWIVKNEVLFTDPFDAEDGLAYYPHYAVRHALPENRKSQFVYLRPDLGTIFYPYSALGSLACFLDIDLSHRLNGSPEEAPPPLSWQAMDHIRRFHAWDTLATFSDNDTYRRAA